jgi:hypothetical protein
MLNLRPSSPGGKSRPNGVRVDRPVYPLDRGIQKIPNELQIGV